MARREAEDQKTKVQKEAEDIVSQIYQDKYRELESLQEKHDDEIVALKR